MKGSLRFTAAVFAAALTLAGCSGTGNNKKQESSVQESSAQQQSTAAELPEFEDDGIEYQIYVTTKSSVKEELLKGAWMYLDGAAFDKEPGSVFPDADKDAWYYGSTFWFNSDGTGTVTIGKNDSTFTYVINDDTTISITRGNPEETEKYALGQFDEYGIILYSKTDKNIVYYQAIF